MDCIAEQVLDAVKQCGLEGLIESSGRNTLKIPTNKFYLFPSNVASELQTLKKVSTTFGGKVGQKVFTTFTVKFSYTNV